LSLPCGNRIWGYVHLFRGTSGNHVAKFIYPHDSWGLFNWAISQTLYTPSVIKTRETGK
jgi:hypothetical protein